MSLCAQPWESAVSLSLNSNAWVQGAAQPGELSVDAPPWNASRSPQAGQSHDCPLGAWRQGDSSQGGQDTPSLAGFRQDQELSSCSDWWPAYPGLLVGRPGRTARLQTLSGPSEGHREPRGLPGGQDRRGGVVIELGDQRALSCLELAEHRLALSSPLGGCVGGQGLAHPHRSSGWHLQCCRLSGWGPRWEGPRATSVRIPQRLAVRPWISVAVGRQAASPRGPWRKPQPALPWGTWKPRVLWGFWATA